MQKQTSKGMSLNFDCRNLVGAVFNGKGACVSLNIKANIMRCSVMKRSQSVAIALVRAYHASMIATRATLAKVRQVTLLALPKGPWVLFYFTQSQIKTPSSPHRRTTVATSTTEVILQRVDLANLKKPEQGAC